jgi:dethiobiotin synthase
VTARFLVVTGTGTGVGKTVVTAALAARSPGCLVVKPVQTGVGPDEPGDADEVRRLAGVDVAELVRLPDPLAPDTAARLAGVAIPTVAAHAERIRALAAEHETVIVEGAGGLLVRLDADGGTLLDLAAALAASVVVVVAAGLGTLNHTELTVAALRQRGVEPVGLVIGAWPDSPDLAERCNLEDLPRVTRVPLLARIPEGAGSLDGAAFRRACPDWLPGLPA